MIENSIKGERIMDRFKFRAKRLDNNEFVYGYLCFVYIDNEKHCRIYSPDDTMSYDCYTDTLGQCTDLKDKNGKLIYENDLIKCPSGIYRIAVDDFGLWTAIYENNPLKGVVEWSDIVKNYAFNQENVEIEVIGNGHEKRNFE